MNRLLSVLLISLAMACGCSNSPSPGDREASKGHEAFDGGNYQQAIVHFQKAQELGLRHYSLAETLSSIGNCHNKLGDLEEALVWHEKALEEDTQSHTVWVNKGIVHRLLGQLDKAEACYRKATAINPDYPELHASLGALYIHRGKTDLAIATLEKAINLDSTMAIAHSNLAIALAMKGKYSEAEVELLLANNHGYRNGKLVQRQIQQIRDRAGKK